MDEDRWSKVGALLEEASEVPPTDREAFLRERCDDPRLREEVLSLLGLSEQADGFFENLESALPSGVQSLDASRSTAAEAPSRRLADPLNLEGTQVGRYDVQAHLGGGGMGVVYKAHDPDLDRTVALKFLPPYLAASEEAAERFAREARAASALEHPHIATIYEIDTAEYGAAEGQRYIAMAYYDGETLKKKIQRGPLPVDTALRYARQIAEALSQAHDAGIVHRDVKPANVMITGSGEVKLVDFGLAQVADQSRLTEPGRRIGTVTYMSPEQIEGQRVDERTDLWALGVVLYEMLTGTRPFQGERESSLLNAILLEEPAPLRRHRAEVPPAIEVMVTRCLQKDPEDRFPTAAELSKELQRVEQKAEEAPANQEGIRHRLSVSTGRLVSGAAGLAAAVLGLWLVLTALDLLPAQNATPSSATDTRFGAPQEEPGLVVLPCPSEGEAAMLCTGLMATVTDQLVQMQPRMDAWVVPADEVRARGATTPSAARRIYNADLILTGALMREEEHVDLEFSLLDGETAEKIESEEMDLLTANVTVLQTDAASVVARMMGAAPPSQNRGVQTIEGTAVPGAYLSYLEGHGHLWWANEGDSLRAAIDAFQRSIDQDPVFARAHAGLCESLRHRYETSEDRQARAKAKQHCDRALALNEQLADAHKARGLLLKDSGQYEEAVQAFQRARTLRPHRADLHRELASVYEAQGQSDRAENTYQKIVYRWPDYWVGYDNLGDFYASQGRLEAAATQFLHAVDAAPQNVEMQRELAANYIYLGNQTKARQIFEDLVDRDSNYRVFSNLGTIYFQDGRYADAAQMYENALDLKSDDYRLWGNLAAAHYWSGNREKARDYYEQAAQMAEEQRETSPQQPLLLCQLGAYYAMLDEGNQARSLIQKALSLAPEEWRVTFYAAVTYEQLDERDQALEWIERSLTLGIPPPYVKRQRGLRQLRADPRFQEILANKDVS